MKQRDPGLIFVNSTYQELIDKDLCPICLKPRQEWTRKRQFKCCSPECTKKFYEDPNGWTFGWSHMRNKILERDDFTCLKCGKCPTSEKHYGIDNAQVWIQPDRSKLVVDHILPIALGGDEYDPSNLQTLCQDCNKVKTAEDLKMINRERYKEINGEYKLTREEYIAKTFHKLDEFV